MAKIRIGMPRTPGLIEVEDSFEQSAPPEAFTNVQNVRFNDKGAQSILGEHRVMYTVDEFGIPSSSDPPTPYLWVKYFPTRDTPRWVVHAGNGEMYVHENNTWTAMKAGSPFTSGISNPKARMQGFVFNGVGVFSNGYNTPQYWAPMTAATPLVSILISPAYTPTGFFKPFRNFLIGGAITEGANYLPFRVRWSHPAVPGALPTMWDIADPAQDAGEFDFEETPDIVVDGQQMGDQFIVYREHTVWGMALTGDSNVFRKYRILAAGGLVAKDCFAVVPGGQVALGWDDIYFHQGTPSSYQSLLDGRARRDLASRLDPDKAPLSFVMLNSPEKEVWFCIPEFGSLLPNVAYVWNWATGKLGMRPVSGYFGDSGPIDPLP